MQMIQRSFGETTNNALKPFTMALGDIFKSIADSQFPKLFAEQMLKPLQSLVGIGGNSKSTFLDVLATLASIANVIPRNLSKFISDVKDIQQEKNWFAKAGKASVLALQMTPTGLMAGMGERRLCFW